MTDAETSSPRCAGKQCINIESLVVSFINCSLTANGDRERIFSLRSDSESPIDIQTSVYKTDASCAADSGSFESSIFPPLCAAIFFATSTTIGSGAHLPPGVAATTCAPMIAPMINQACDMLLPSPR